jgi:hypothetical protein
VLKEVEQFLYIYVVARDFGFAPNPFHRYCTLATCKPDIRKTARLNDWVMGVGGRRLNATGRCVYLMKVTEICTFDEYWLDARFELKKPLRNGSLKMMVGDNIYHRKSSSDNWIQEDSHHSNSDSSPNLKNLATDTSSENVLISQYFFYFGCDAPLIDLASVGYTNVRNYRKMPLKNDRVSRLVKSVEIKYKNEINAVEADPFDFREASKRVDQSTGRIG